MLLLIHLQFLLSESIKKALLEQFVTQLTPLQGEIIGNMLAYSKNCYSFQMLGPRHYVWDRKCLRKSKGILNSRKNSWIQTEPSPTFGAGEGVRGERRGKPSNGDGGGSRKNVCHGERARHICSRALKILPERWQAMKTVGPWVVERRDLPSNNE